MSGGATPDGIGVRVARVRKRRGLTQHGLAQRSRYSRSHIAQVEAGHKVATPGFVASVAAALAVDSAEIYGQPYRSHTRDHDQVHGSISDLRRAMAYVDVGPELDTPPRALNQISAAVANALALRRQARHLQLAARLPGIVEELTWHVYEVGSPRAWTMLNQAHNLAASLTRRLGYNDLSGQIMERATVSAAHSEDPHLPLMIAHRRSLLMMGVAAYGPAVRLLDKSIRKVDRSRPDAIEVLGALNLRAAVVSARGGKSADAWDYYGQATEVSRAAGGPTLDEHGTDYNPGNLAIHGAAIALELGDLDEAARRDEEISEAALLGLAAERRAHHQIDMARVRVELGDYNRALSRLLTAEQTAPQMTRYHPSARTIVDHLMDVRRTVPESLRQLHNRMSA
ncbi:helix-turn-helix domain-containing protein [Actinomadura macra]|uniref:helix-turn-helix domain-containing protein n=1 Tax=Actinomadura macra TaxID=46164 RepID=UPI00082C29DE|nr:helix-turn-helix domain-containing protein [Actinomadura macra]